MRSGRRTSISQERLLEILAEVEPGLAIRHSDPSSTVLLTWESCWRRLQSRCKFAGAVRGISLSPWAELMNAAN